MIVYCINGVVVYSDGDELPDGAELIDISIFGEHPNHACSKNTRKVDGVWKFDSSGVAARIALSRENAIKVRLNELDLSAVRPLRANAAGTATQEDIDHIAANEAEASALRAELATLP